MRPRPLPLVAAAALALAACGGGSAAGSTNPNSRPLRKASVDCLLDPAYGVLGDNNATLTLDTKGTDDADGVPDDQVGCVLKELLVTDAVIAHIDSTRALDGSQTDSWPGYTARWTYHPDVGLTLIVQEAK